MNTVPIDPQRVDEEAASLTREERFALDAILASASDEVGPLDILTSYARRGLLSSAEVLHIRRAIEAVDD